MSEPRKVNWAWIKRRWIIQNGQGVRALGRAYGVAHTTISRRAQAEGWANEPQPKADSFAFNYDGTMFSPRAEDVTWLRTVWGKRINARITRERALDAADVVSAWNEAALYACRRYRYGGAEGFERLLGQSWANIIRTMVRDAPGKLELTMEAGDLEALSAFEPVLRPILKLKLDGWTDADIQSQFGMTIGEYKAIKRKMAQGMD